MKNFISILLLPCLLLAVACSSVKDEPPTPGSRPSKEAARTVLVYMVAANSLSGFDNDDLSEMRLAAKNGAITDGHLVVYHSNYDSNVLFEINSAARFDTLAVYDSSISVSIDRMRQVVADVKALAPARDYGMVLWSHANGWLVDGQKESSDAPVKYSYGNDRGKKMNIESLAEALDGADMSFLYFDCCFMGGVEVMYALRSVTPTVVASVTELPADGMRYDLNVGCFFAPEPDLTQAARNTFDYYNSLSGENRSCTISVIDLTKIDALAAATADIYASALDIYPEGFSPQVFSGTGFGRCYYFDMQQYVEAICTDSAKLASWRHALDDAVTFAAATSYMWEGDTKYGFPIRHHCGLSTFIFKTEQDAAVKGYNSTAWYADVASLLLHQ